MLGIGGYLALKRLERNITTYHMNEGHAVFLTLALLQEFGGDEETVRQKCVFTTHTPVPAGHDKFSYDLAGKTIGTYLPNNIRTLAGQDLLNTTVLALNLSRASNGVSELHGEVSREMFPGFNIGHVTNGVHHLSWTGEEFKALFDTHLPNWREQPQVLAEAHTIPDDAIKKAKRQAKRRLISYINSVSGAGFTDEHADHLLRPPRRSLQTRHPHLLGPGIPLQPELRPGAVHLCRQSPSSGRCRERS